MRPLSFSLSLFLLLSVRALYPGELEVFIEKKSKASGNISTAISRNGRRFVLIRSGRKINRFYLFNLKSNRLKLIQLQHRVSKGTYPPYVHVHAIPGGGWLTISSHDQWVHRYNPDGKLINRKAGRCNSQKLKVDPAGKYFACIAGPGLLFYDFNGRRLADRKWEGNIWSFNFNRSGTRMVLSTHGYQKGPGTARFYWLEMWNLENPRNPQRIWRRPHSKRTRTGNSPSSLAFHPRGTFFKTRYSIRRTLDGQVFAPDVIRGDFSEDGELIISSSGIMRFGHRNLSWSKPAKGRGPFFSAGEFNLTSESYAPWLTICDLIENKGCLRLLIFDDGQFFASLPNGQYTASARARDWVYFVRRGNIKRDAGLKRKYFRKTLVGDFIGRRN